MFFNKQFILASNSRSRYKILKNIGLNFKKMQPACNEDSLKKNLINAKKKPNIISLELARLKAQSISKIETNKIVIGSDTIISFNDKILSKAKNLIEAKKKILMISGKKHKIFSSASLYLNNKEIWKSTQKTTVKVRPLKKKDVDLYLSQVGIQILHSVGCYQLEAAGPNIIEDIKGDFFNVLGFPLFPFLQFVHLNKINKND